MFLVLSVCLMPLIPVVRATPVQADSVEVQPFVALGANLTDNQKKTVLKQMELSESELDDYKVITVTNEEEHEYLDEYLDKSVIGTRALSSVKIEQAEEGSGISVEAHNISFCTEAMYTNALVTAGISDARVVVAAPFEISGTAALVGAMKAYGAMTGDVIDKESADAATNELVVTGELGESLGQEQAAELVALLKDKVIREDLSSTEEIQKAAEEAASELNLELSEQHKQDLPYLIKKIDGLDLSLDTLKDQAQGIYDKLTEMEIDLDEAQGFLDKIAGFFKDLWDKITSIFG